MELALLSPWRVSLDGRASSTLLNGKVLVRLRSFLRVFMEELMGIPSMRAHNRSILVGGMVVSFFSK